MVGTMADELLRKLFSGRHMDDGRDFEATVSVGRADAERVKGGQTVTGLY